MYQTQHTKHNLWDAASAVLRGKFIAIGNYIKKEKEEEENTNQ